MMLWGVGWMMQCKWAIDNTTIGGGGRQRQATTGDGSCDGGRGQLRRQSTAGEGRCCSGDCDRRVAAAATVGDGGQRQLQRRATAYSSTAGDGHFGGG